MYVCDNDDVIIYIVKIPVHFTGSFQISFAMPSLLYLFRVWKLKVLTFEYK